MQKILEALGGRKFLLTLVVLALAAVIELKTERGISEQFVALLIGVLGVFSAANATISSIAMGKQQPQVSPSTPDTNDLIGQAVADGNIELAHRMAVVQANREQKEPTLEQQALEQILINQREHGEVIAQVAKGVSNTNGLLAGIITKKP